MDQIRFWVHKFTMMANIESFKLLRGPRLSKINLAFLHLLNNVLVLQRTRLVPVFINPPEPVILYKQKTYILADKGVWSLQAGVIKLEDVVLPETVEFEHFFFRHGYFSDVHSSLKLNFIYVIFFNFSLVEISDFSNGLRNLPFLKVFNTVLQVFFNYFNCLHFINFPLGF